MFTLEYKILARFRRKQYTLEEIVLIFSPKYSKETIVQAFSNLDNDDLIDECTIDEMANTETTYSPLSGIYKITYEGLAFLEMESYDRFDRKTGRIISYIALVISAIGILVQLCY